MPHQISIGTFVISGKKQVLPLCSRGALCTLILLVALSFQVGQSVFAASTLPIVVKPEPDLLEPERAFQLSARYKDPKTVDLQFKIAGGYYMYRSKFKFAIEPADVAKLKKVSLSKGIVKEDPTFGRVETYRDSVRILLPITQFNQSVVLANGQPLRLKVTSQGCADVGVCYPPLHQYLVLRHADSSVIFPDSLADSDVLPAPLQSTAASGQSSVTDSLLKNSKLAP